ncbi:MAG: DUF5615 family PIN-like protein [Actinomycetota bacterium]
MRVLLDEQLPVQLLAPLRLNRGHQFDHVDGLGWKGKHDPPLFADAAKRGYAALLTADLDQLSDPEECRALKNAGLHHIGVRGGRKVDGIRGTARVIASLVVAMPYVLDDLATADGQRVVEVSLLTASARHETFDPARARRRFPYWP